MSAPKELRPGLKFYPDAAFYDEEMARLRHELGRAPTPDDVAQDLAIGFSITMGGCPCVTCDAYHAPRLGAAWLPGDVDSLIGYALCDDCGAKKDAGDKDYAATLDAALAAERARRSREIQEDAERETRQEAASWARLLVSRCRRHRVECSPVRDAQAPTPLPVDPRQLAIPGVLQ